MPRENGFNIVARLLNSVEQSASEELATEPTSQGTGNMGMLAKLGVTNPLMSALDKHGIKSVEQLEGVIANAALGTEYMDKIRDYTKSQMIRAKGATDAAKMYSALDAMSISQLTETAQAFEEMADTLHNTNGTSAQTRISTGNSLNANGDDNYASSSENDTNYEIAQNGAVQIKSARVTELLQGSALGRQTLERTGKN